MLDKLNEIAQIQDYSIDETFGGAGLEIRNPRSHSMMVRVGFDNKANRFSIETTGTRLYFEEVESYQKDFYKAIMLMERLNHKLIEIDYFPVK